MRNDFFVRAMRALSVAGCVAALYVADSGVAQAACDAVCQAAFVTGHNNVRTKVNAGLEPAPGGAFQPQANPPLQPLSWDGAVATDAQNYSAACNFAHSGQAGRGENLYASTGVEGPATAANSVTAWDAESSLYTFGTIPAPNQNAVGHYTQLVWANTTKVGCGITSCNANSPFGAQFPTWTLVVCQYTPQGNFLGQTPYVAGVPPPVVPGGVLDVDGNGQYDALTDGLIILRYMFGLTGSPLTASAIGPNATRNTPALVLANLILVRPNLDVDGNGNVDALTDGLLILRHLFGLRGAPLVAGAVGPLPTRGTAALIEPYIDSLRP